jgi:hypothetical protein
MIRGKGSDNWRREPESVNGLSLIALGLQFATSACRTGQLPANWKSSNGIDWLVVGEYLRVVTRDWRSSWSIRFVTHDFQRGSKVPRIHYCEW